MQEREGVVAAGQAPADRQVPGYNSGLQLTGSSPNIPLPTGWSRLYWVYLETIIPKLVGIWEDKAGSGWLRLNALGLIKLK